MECDIQILAGLFESLRLAELDKDWVETVYASEFTDEQCDVELNFTRNTENTIESCNSFLKKIVRNENANDGFSYFLFANSLNERGIDAKTIQSFIFCLLINSLKGTAETRQKTLGLLAADLYFLLLHVGGETSQLYHAIVFDKAVLTLPNALRFDVSGGKRDGDADGHSNSNSSASVTARDMTNVSKQLFVTLTDFCKYLSRKSLRSNILSLNRAMQALCSVVSMLPFMTSVNFNKFEGSSPDTMSPIEVALLGLYYSTDKKHGKTNELFQNLARFLLPILIMKTAGNSSASSIPQMYIRKSQIVCKFVRYLMCCHGDNIADGVLLLIQNMILKFPDRAEFRNKMGLLVSEILQDLPFVYYSDFCKWLAKILSHEKSHFRGNAIVVLGRLLGMPERRQGVDQGEIESLQPSRVENQCNSEALMQEASLPPECVDSAAVSGQPQRAYNGNSIAATMTSSVQSAVNIGTPVPYGNAQEPQLTMDTNALQSATAERSCFSTNDTANNRPSSSAAEMQTMGHKYFLKLLFNSLQDHTPSVRLRVLIGMIDVMKVGVVSRSYLSNLNTSDDTFSTLLRNCIMDSKAMVRKAAVQTLETALCLEFVTLSKDSILLLEKCCKDPSLIVRKQAILSLTEVMKRHQKCSIVHSSWINGVLPAIADRESTVQAKVDEIVECMVLDNVKSTQGERVDLAWNLVKYLASENAWQFLPYLEKIFAQWNRQMKLDLRILKNIIREIENLDRKETCQAAWLLAQVFTLYKCNEESASTIVTAWKREFDKRHSLAFHSHAIMTIGQIVKYIPLEDKKLIIQICSKQLKSFRCPIQLIPCLIETTCNLIQCIVEQEMDSSAMSWCQSLLEDCDSFFSEVLFKHTDNHSLKLDSLINHLHVAGNIGKHFADIIPKRLLLSMQALVTGNDCLKQLSQSTVNSQQLSQQMEPISQLLKNIELPQYVSTHAILNLGKIAIHNQKLAKKIVPALVHELDTCDSDIIRSNLVVILTDLCAKATQLIDPHLSNIANCLGDQSDGVRRNALILLNSLLKKEYIKWKGSLVYKVLTLLCDKNQGIRELAFYCLTEQRLIRQPGDFYFRHFVETVFYFNGYEKHRVYNRFTKTERERSLFNFKGEENYSSRFKVYEFMLQRMQDDNRFNLTLKLCMDVLDAYVDEIIPLSEKDLLSDSLDILCCEDIKLRCMKSSDDDVEMEEVQSVTAANGRNAVHQKLISQVMKFSLIENIIPIIIALKNLMVVQKSPLLRNVMLYLKDVMKGYKTEVQDILAADKQLAKEIEFDLKRFERSFEQPAVPAIQVEGTPARQQLRGVNTVPTTPLSVARGRGLGIQAILNTAGKNRNRTSSRKTRGIPLNLETDGLPVVISTPARDEIRSTDVTFAISGEISAIDPSS